MAQNAGIIMRVPIIISHQLKMQILADFMVCQQKLNASVIIIFIY